jgi:ribonucleoside-diphosphate reductase, alpha subunit
MKVTKRDGRLEELDITNIRKQTIPACEGLDGVSYEELELSAQIFFTDGIKTSDIQESLIKAAQNKIELDTPNWTYVAARLRLYDYYHKIKRYYDRQGSGDVYECVPLSLYLESNKDMFSDFINKYTKEEIGELNKSIMSSRDLLFDNPGVITLLDRYCGLRGNANIELPQHMFMTIAMYIAQNEKDKIKWAKTFYEYTSLLKIISATPINANGRFKDGSTASCFLTSIADNIDSIFDSYKEIALGSKVGGGWGVDITRLRSVGSRIKFKDNAAGGVVPFVKVLNDIALAVDQNGKRAGAFAIYLETWHIDFLDFLDMCKRQGEDRRRGQDLFYSASVSDLFIKRIKENGTWTFFDPVDVPELSETWGEEFEKHYLQAEDDFKNNRRKFNLNTKTIPITDLISKMVYNWSTEGKLFWFFKDTVNREHKHKHLGIIRSSNLCSEIAMPTSETSTAVCNLGSINISRVHSTEDLIDTSKVIARMLDNVIDVTDYHSSRSGDTQKAYRSYGVGSIGEAEYLATHKIMFGSKEHEDEIRRIYGTVSKTLKETSEELAKEKGSCIIPGIRNAYRMAIAPNTSSGLLAGSTCSCEPIYAREWMENSKLGSYKMVAPHVNIENISYYKNAYELDQGRLLELTAMRQQYIDMAISHSLYIDPTDFMGTGRPVSAMDIIKLIVKAHKLGVKTLYYFRAKARSNKNIETKEHKISCVGCEN